MSNPNPMSPLAPCRIHYATDLNLAEFTAKMRTACNTLAMSLPLNVTTREDQPGWKLESVLLKGVIFVLHSDLRDLPGMAQAALENDRLRILQLEPICLVAFCYRSGDREALEHLVEFIGLKAEHKLHDIDASVMGEEDYSVTDKLLRAQVGMLAEGFHVLDHATLSGTQLVQTYTATVVEEIAELTAIREAIDRGDAEARFGRERVAQYLRTEPEPMVVTENTRTYTLPHTLHIPSDADTTLRVHYAWDPVWRLHIIGHVDEYPQGI